MERGNDADGNISGVDPVEGVHGAQIAGSDDLCDVWGLRGRSRASEKDGGGGLSCGCLRGGHVLTMIVVCATNRDADGIFPGCVCCLKLI